MTATAAASTAALALPMLTQAAPMPSVSAGAVASAHAQLDLTRAAELAAQAGARSQRAARRMLGYGQSRLATAVARTDALLSSARTPSQSQLAIAAGTQMGGALAQDAGLEATVASDGGTALADAAAAALNRTVRMEQATVAATLQLAATAARASGSSAGRS